MTLVTGHIILWVSVCLSGHKEIGVSSSGILGTFQACSLSVWRIWDTFGYMNSDTQGGGYRVYFLQLAEQASSGIQLGGSERER